jgi:uncharacterized membrane protein
MGIVDRLAPAGPFRRLVTAAVAAAVGVPAFVYGVFALTWPIQRWLYVGSVGSVVALLAGVLALVAAHSLVADVSGRAAAAGSEAGSHGESVAGGEYAEEDEATPEADPVATLKRRYAAGELGDDEFERGIERLVELDESTARDAAVDDRLLERE